MSRTTLTLLAALAALTVGAGCGGSAPAKAAPSNATGDAGAVPPVRLYTLDCGRLEMNDAGFFAAANTTTGKPMTLTDPCFVIQHPKGILLWDTGLAESIGASKTGASNPLGTEFVDAPTLRDQLATISLSPAQITFVGFSHLHADHAGNANLFTASTWLVSRKELEAATGPKPPMGVDPKAVSEHRNVKTKLLDADEDVFGDGTVRILQTPGHTVGHQSLAVKLAGAGTLILSGDLAHSRANWENHVVPWFNQSRENTAASMTRIEAILADTKGRFIVQHSPDDIRTLPKFPAYLE